MGRWVDPSWWTHSGISSRSSTTGVPTAVVGYTPPRLAFYYSPVISIFLKQVNQYSTTGVATAVVGYTPPRLAFYYSPVISIFLKQVNQYSTTGVPTAVVGYTPPRVRGDSRASYCSTDRW